MQLVSRAKVHVVIPAYNEGPVISRVVSDVTAQAGVVSESASYVLGFLVFLGVFGAACILILVGRNVGDAWRESDEAEARVDLNRIPNHPPAPEHPPVTLAGTTGHQAADEIPWDDDVRQRHHATTEH